MPENGKFRTRLFGGFNKNDVFEYFDRLQLDAQQNNKGLLAKIDKQQLLLDEKEAQIKELKDALLELKTMCEQSAAENEQAQALKGTVQALKDELERKNARQSEESGYKSRCETLSRKLVKCQSELLMVRGELQKEKIRNSKLIGAIREIPLLNSGEFKSRAAALTDIASMLELTETISKKILNAKSKADLNG